MNEQNYSSIRLDSALRGIQNPKSIRQLKNVFKNQKRPPFKKKSSFSQQHCVRFRGIYASKKLFTNKFKNPIRRPVKPSSHLENANEDGVAALNRSMHSLDISFQHNASPLISHKSVPSAYSSIKDMSMASADRSHASRRAANSLDDSSAPPPPPIEDISLASPAISLKSLGMSSPTRKSQAMDTSSHCNASPTYSNKSLGMNSSPSRHAKSQPRPNSSQQHDSCSMESTPVIGTSSDSLRSEARSDTTFMDSQSPSRAGDIDNLDGIENENTCQSFVRGTPTSTNDTSSDSLRSEARSDTTFMDSQSPSRAGDIDNLDGMDLDVSRRHSDLAHDSNSASLSPSSSTPNVQPFCIPKLLDLIFEKPNVDSKLLNLFCELGETLTLAILEEQKINKFLKQFMRKENIKMNNQKEYARSRKTAPSGNEVLSIRTVKKGENEEEPLYDPHIYAIKVLYEDQSTDDQFVVVKIGATSNTSRKHDYINDDKQSYVRLLDMRGSWAKEEKVMDEAYTKFLRAIADLEEGSQVSTDFKALCVMINRGGKNFGVRRMVAIRAIESYFCTLFFIESHLLNNPHEFIALMGSNEVYTQRERFLSDLTMKVRVYMVKRMSNRTNLHLVRVCETWPVAVQWIDQSQGGIYVSAQIQAGRYTCSSIPGGPDKVEDLLAPVINPTHAFDTSFRKQQRQAALDKFKCYLEETEKRPGSVLIAYYNSEATKHISDRKNLYDICVRDCGWVEELAILNDDEGNKSHDCPAVRFCFKNESCVIFMESSGLAFNPLQWRDQYFQRDLFFQIHLMNRLLASFTWDGNESIENEPTAFMAGMWCEKMHLIKIGWYYMAYLLKAKFVYDAENIDMLADSVEGGIIKIGGSGDIAMIENAVTGDVESEGVIVGDDIQFGKYLNRTVYFTQQIQGMKVEYSYGKERIYLKSIRDKELRHFIRDHLDGMEVLKTMRGVMIGNRKSKEDFENAVKTLVDVVKCMFIVRHDVENREVMNIVFETLYAKKYIPNDLGKGDSWTSIEIQQYIEGFTTRYGNDLSKLVPKNLDNRIIKCFVPTRDTDSVKNFLRNNVYKKVTKAKKKTLTFGDVLDKLKKLLKDRQEMEKYAYHYVKTKKHNNLFRSNPGNRRVREIFQEEFSKCPDKKMSTDEKEAFSKRLIQSMNEENIKFYEYKGASFTLADPLEFFIKNFQDWKEKINEDKPKVFNEKKEKMEGRNNYLKSSRLKATLAPQDTGTYRVLELFSQRAQIYKECNDSEKKVFIEEFMAQTNAMNIKFYEYNEEAQNFHLLLSEDVKVFLRAKFDQWDRNGTATEAEAKSESTKGGDEKKGKVKQKSKVNKKKSEANKKKSKAKKRARRRK